MSPPVLTAVVGGLALVLTAMLTPLVRRAAISGGMVRQVQADRWHRRPTPAVGGVAIFLGFGLALGVGYVVDPGTTRGLLYHAPRAVLPWTPWGGLVAAATAAFLLGLLDDLLRLGPLPKLLGQLAAASLLLLSGIGVWLTGVYAVDAAISLLWFVGITNALNLLDNMDGLAGGVGAIAGGYLALLFVLEGSTGLAILALGLSASLVGFLAHNYPPARIFMGDSGSLFVGLFLAGLALAPAEGLSRSLAAVLAAPVLILGVPILDTTLVTVGRILEGRPVSQGGRDHTSHRFVDLGVPETRTVLMLWGLAAVGGAAGVLLRSAERGTALLVGGVLVGALTLVGGYLLSVRFRTLEGTGGEGLSLYRWVIAAHRRYPFFTLLLDAVWFVLAYYAAYLLRWGPAELPAELPYFQRTVVLFVGVKLIAFILAGVYGTHTPRFGLHEALGVARANLLATLMAAGTLLLVERVGLSRGVLAIDLLVCSLFTIGARMSFRLLETTTRRWSEEGVAAVVLAPEDSAELAVRLVESLSGPRFRAVAAASPATLTARARVGGLPLYGGSEALRRALRETGAGAVVVVAPGDGEGPEHAALREHLEQVGGVDVYRMDINLRPMDKS